MMKNKVMKKLLAGFLGLALVMTAFIGLPEKTQAADATVVQYQKGIDYTTFKDCIENKKAPTCGLDVTGNTGYLFAGWYQCEDDVVGVPITALSEVTEGTTVAAKFVPAHLTGIACQVKADVEVEGVTQTNLRVVSLVDSTNYAAVGFNVYGRHDNDGDGIYTEWLMYKYNSEGTNAAQSKKVYSGLNVYKMQNGEVVVETVKTPADVFGTDAEGFKFTTMSLSGIPKASYGTTIAIKPYWITYDGTVVEGMGEFNQVQDCIDGIVNVSVNLKDAADIAAGMIEIAYDSLNFKYESMEPGRVFEELEIRENTTGTLRCIGNVANITENAAEPNDVFVNLKFSKTEANSGTTAVPVGTANFAVTIPDIGGFCTNKEVPKTVSAWDVKY